MTTQDQTSWHVRQKITNRLQAENKELRQQLLEEKAITAKYKKPPTPKDLEAAEVMEQAKTLLAAMKPDPYAAAHRYAIWQEIHPRKVR